LAKEGDLEFRAKGIRYRPVSSSLIERWLGREQTENISQHAMNGLRIPVPVANVPGHVYACPDGDFAGKILCGQEANLQQLILDRLKVEYLQAGNRPFSALGQRLVNGWRSATRVQHGRLNGFASLSDLISEATTGGKKQVLPFQKVGIAAPAAGASQELWRVGNVPAAGATAATANGGTVYDNTQTGRLGQVNAAGGDTLHFINGHFVSNAAQGSSLLLCDKLFAVNRDYNNAAAQAITGVPTRYQTATTAPGNIQFTNVTTTFGATPSNIVLTYVDQDGNTAEAGPAQVVRISSAADTNPLTQPLWVYLLNAGDTGLRSLTNFDLTAAMGAGAADRGIYHPIAILPGIGIANTPMFVDGINTAFNFERIFDGATLVFIEWFKSATGAATYTGNLTFCSG